LFKRHFIPLNCSAHLEG